ncbi:MAG: hypothetical protein IT371_05985 [Deltaproteobacteria bacterium]|nr:hypothetical protein [Deltaproteobacteria bacterium]
MRAVWVDHVAWTRAYLVAAIAGLPETEATAARLMQNQTDIGKAIEPFYGKVAGDGLATLLREHIAIAAELVTAAKSGDADKVSDARTRWGKNADQLAAFLAAANPNWPLKDLTEMMRLHLDQTLTEATARLTGDWAGDIKAYDAAASHILMMADALSGGIARQFPGSVL